MRKLVYSVALFACTLLVSCDDQLVFEKNVEIPSGIWSKSNPVELEFDVRDTLQLNNFYVNIRNGEEYSFSNLFLFIEMEFPNGKKSIDTLECPLADPSGKWYGSGFGNLYDNRIIFRERKQFPLAGHYKVKMVQAMRADAVEGIYDIGFRVAQVDNN